MPKAAEVTAIDRPQSGQTARRLPRRRYWRKAFLASLEGGATVNLACVTAGVAVSTAYHNRKTDPAFAQEWIDADQAGLAVLEAEAHRRAVEGWDEPQFYQGEVSGHVRRYDSKLLQFLLSSRHVKYTQRREVHHSGGVQHEHRLLLPCNGRDIVHAPGVCPICDGARARLRAATIHGEAVEAPPALSCTPALEHAPAPPVMAAQAEDQPTPAPQRQLVGSRAHRAA